MRICIIGDAHFRGDLPYSSSLSDGRKTEWESVKRTIHETAKSCDVVVLMGDNLNSKNNTSSVLREFVEFLKEFGDKPIHILAGNHERNGFSTALDFLQKINHTNWHVYTDITQGVHLSVPLGFDRVVEDVNATFIPYVTPAILGVTNKEEAEEMVFKSLKPADVAFAHHAISGAKSTKFFDHEIVLDKEKMGNLFGMTFAGHLHEAQSFNFILKPASVGMSTAIPLQIKKIQLTGSIFTQETGEHDKSIWVWNSQTKITEKVPLPVRGIYKIQVEQATSYTEIPDNSIVKAIVSDRFFNNEEGIRYIKSEILGRFDASILVEQYPSERTKVHFEDGGLDLSVDSMLKRYSEAKELSYTDLSEGFELIK